MSQTLSSILFGILSGVISLLGVYFFLFSNNYWPLVATLFGLFTSWNFVPIGGRHVAWVNSVPDAYNGATLCGWALAILGTGIFLIL